MFTALLVFGLIFVAPIGGTIWFVSWRSRVRAERQRGPWTAVAQKLGGKFTPAPGFFGGNRIEIPRPHAQVVLETAVISRIEAFATTYHPDGGTYTHARAAYAGGDGPMLKLSQFELDHEPLCAGIPSARGIPAEARIFSRPHEVIVVMPGAVIDTAALEAAAEFVSTVAERVAAAGEAVRERAP